MDSIREQQVRKFLALVGQSNYKNYRNIDILLQHPLPVEVYNWAWLGDKLIDLFLGEMLIKENITPSEIHATLSVWHSNPVFANIVPDDILGLVKKNGGDFGMNYKSVVFEAFAYLVYQHLGLNESKKWVIKSMEKSAPERLSDMYASKVSAWCVQNGIKMEWEKLYGTKEGVYNIALMLDGELFEKATARTKPEALQKCAKKAYVRLGLGEVND